MRDTLADSPVVAVKFPRIAVGAEPRGGVVLVSECGQPRREESHERAEVSSQVVRHLQASGVGGVAESEGERRAAGADGVTLGQFEESLKR